MTAPLIRPSERPVRHARPSAQPRSSRFVARELLLATRPHQWVKNVLVFAAPAVAGVLFSPTVFATTLLAAIAFCAASAATYLLNDIADVDADRLHPTKQLRPIAAGTLPIDTAQSAAAIAAAVAVGLAAGTGPTFLACLAGYLTLTSVYSRWLKHVPIVDVVTIAVGFVLRVVAGSVAIGVASPGWFLAAVGFGAVLISLGKRYGEVGRLGGDAAEHRAVLGWYRPPRTRSLMVASQTACFATAAIWLWLTVPPVSAAVAAVAVAVILDRFRRLVLAGDVDDPVRLIVTDRAIAGAELILLAVLAAGIYL